MNTKVYKIIKRLKDKIEVGDIIEIDGKKETIQSIGTSYYRPYGEPPIDVYTKSKKHFYFYAL